MSETILCPQCEKHYSLPDLPPATFTCRQCGALVDLSAFGGKDRSAKAPAAPAKGRRPERGPRRQGPSRTAPASKAPVAAIVVIALIVIVLIAVRSGGDDDSSPAKLPKKTAAKSPAPTPTQFPQDEPEQRSPRRTRKPSLAKVNADGSLKLRFSRIELKRLEWPEEVSTEIRTQADQAIRTMYVGGADGKDAEAWLLAQGRPIAGRLISEFAAIRESPGIDNRDGTSMAMQVDALLHKIDGFIERACLEDGKISSTGFYAGQSFITRTAKRWTWWWESGEWKSKPRKPWDPFEDESDDTPDGRKKPAPAKEDPKQGQGFGKRAGSG